MNTTSPTRTRAKSHQRTRHNADRLARLTQEHEQRVKSKGYVFTGDLTMTPEAKEFIARLIQRLSTRV